MKKCCLLMMLLLAPFVILSQNPYFIIAPNYGPKPGAFLFNLPAPTVANDPGYPLNGYDGRQAQRSQNIEVDNNNKIVFFH